MRRRRSFDGFGVGGVGARPTLLVLVLLVLGLASSSADEPKPDAKAGDLPSDIVLRRPVGALPIDQLRTYEIEVVSGKQVRGRVVFRRDGVLLHEEAFLGKAHGGARPIPEWLWTTLRPGERVTWGVELEGPGGAVYATFARRIPYEAPEDLANALPPIDAEDEAAYLSLAAEVGVPVSRTPLGGRPSPGSGTQLSYPRGPIRREELRWFGIDVRHEHDDASTLEFRRGGQALHASRFSPHTHFKDHAVPTEVRRAVRVGDRVTWGIRNPEGEIEASATFEIVDRPDVDARIAALRRDERLARQAPVVREMLEVDVLLAHGLWSEAVALALWSDRVWYESRWEPVTPQAAPTFHYARYLRPAWAPVPEVRPGVGLTARAAYECLVREFPRGCRRLARLWPRANWRTPAELVRRAEQMREEIGVSPDALNRRQRSVLHLRDLTPEDGAAEVWDVLDLDEARSVGGASLAEFLLQVHPESDRAALRALMDAAYVENPAARGALAEAELRRARGYPAEALTRLDAAPTVEDSVLAYRIERLRGRCLGALGRPVESCEAYVDASGVAAHLGWRAGAADALLWAERAVRKDGADDLLFSVFERRVDLYRACGDRLAEGTTLFNLGVLAHERGRMTVAVGRMIQAREAFAAAGRPDLEAQALFDLGVFQVDAGNWADALAALENGRDLLDDDEEDPRTALFALHQGIVFGRLGEFERAYELLDQALDLYTKGGDVPGRARALASIANVKSMEGRPEEALALYVRAAKLFEAAYDPRMAARVRCALGDLLVRMARFEDALQVSRKAEAAARQEGDAESALMAASNAGAASAGLGNAKEARAAYRTVRREAKARGLQPLVFEQHVRTAQLDLAESDARSALNASREAVLTLRGMTSGLGAAQGPMAEGLRAGAFRCGVDAAVALRDPGLLLKAIEAGRANALLASLRGRGALHAAVVPKGFLEEERKARAVERRALDRLRRARTRGLRSSIREAEGRYETARRRRVMSQERIDRRIRAVAPHVEELPLTLRELQVALQPAETLVLYALTRSGFVALVVEAKDARIVTLGAHEAIEQLVTVSVPGLRPRTQHDLRGPLPSVPTDERGADPTNGAERLRAAIVEPLELRDTGRILVSPAGVLAFAPLTMLVPDREIVHVHSATSWRVRKAALTESADGVLAVGDPVYGPVPGRRTDRRHAVDGARLPPLPATRAEAESVGTVVLLGPDACESAIETRLRRMPRWRAVHFACHGRFHGRRPLLSSLVLSPDAEHDGLLTAYEVMGLRVPADLVFLSACETGRGRYLQGEGALGLPRAFAIAGASSVVCSLWKVDDEATRALVEHFYALWNPEEGTGSSAPAALREAQRRVRSEPKWRDPHYWAAWVLWGGD